MTENPHAPPIKLQQLAVDIGIIMRDSDEMLRFYRSALRLPEIIHSPSLTTNLDGPERTMFEFLVGSSHLRLWQIIDGAPEAAPSGRLAQSGFRYITIWVSNLNQVVQRIKVLGFPVADPPHRSRRGATLALAFLQDPDGNWIELIERDERES